MNEKLEHEMKRGGGESIQRASRRNKKILDLHCDCPLTCTMNKEGKKNGTKQNMMELNVAEKEAGEGAREWRGSGGQATTSTAATTMGW